MDRRGVFTPGKLYIAFGGRVDARICSVLSRVNPEPCKDAHRRDHFRLNERNGISFRKQLAERVWLITDLSLEWEKGFDDTFHTPRQDFNDDIDFWTRSVISRQFQRPAGVTGRTVAP